jgi:nitronate monooxygenase
VDKPLEQMLNLLLESERAGVAALEHLIPEVEQAELRQFLLGERDEEQRNVEGLLKLIRDGGGTPTNAVGPFAAKVAALGTLRERLNLMSHGQEWVARKVEETLAIAPDEGPIHEFLRSMGNRHRAEIEWGRAEVIRLLNTDK